MCNYPDIYQHVKLTCRIFMCNKKMKQICASPPTESSSLGCLKMINHSEKFTDPARLPAGSIFMDSSSFSNQPQSLSDSKSGSASYPGVEEVDVSYLRGEKKIGGGLTICELKISFPLKVMENSILANGKILASIFPENTHCAWIIPPKYDAYRWGGCIMSVFHS